MLMSMTGFARSTVQLPAGELVWELKSVNHRFLDTSFRLPEQFKCFEYVFRQLLNKRLKRGKVECVLRYTPDAGASDGLALNADVLNQLVSAAEQVKTAFDGKNQAVDVMQVLSWPGLVATKGADTSDMAESLALGLEQTLTKLRDMREAEGKHLAAFMNERLDQMLDLVADIEKGMPVLLQAMRDKLSIKFAELKVDCDPDRFEQEVVWLLQKADVAEELHRLGAHVEEVRSVLKQPGAIGRRLDFLMQELNREANTLASKSIDLVVTNASVDLKVLIEQMREQVQNIE